MQDKFNVNETIKNHINLILNKMHTVSFPNEYKTIIDTLDRLINVHSPLFHMQPATYRNLDRDIHFYYFEDDTYKFVVYLTSTIENEIKKVSANGESSLLVEDYKRYRDWLISYDKLIRLYNDLNELLRKHNRCKNYMKEKTK